MRLEDPGADTGDAIGRLYAKQTPSSIRHDGRGVRMSLDELRSYCAAAASSAAARNAESLSDGTPSTRKLVDDVGVMSAMLMPDVFRESRSCSLTPPH